MNGLASVAQLSLWLSLGVLAYAYGGYPAAMWARARLRPRRLRAVPGEPRLSVVVVAYNEAGGIAARIANLIRLDYPRDRLEIVVACDGADDGTAEEARRFAGVRVVEFAGRRGKSAVLNDVVPRTRGEIVVFADVRQRFARDALRRLASDFADSDVGAVSGELKLLPNAGGSQLAKGSDFYWRYEKFIRRCEASVDSSVGATGAVYAIRRSLFRPVPPSTLLDDVVIPMNVVRQGYRVLFDPSAVAFDRATATARAEFGRKIRTIAGNFQLFLVQPWLLDPRKNRLWIQTLSHKGLRLLGPFCLAAALAANGALIAYPFYRFLFLAQIAFYAAAGVGRATRDGARKHALLNVPYAFCVLNWATVVAFVRFVRGRQRAAWDRTRG